MLKLFLLLYADDIIIFFSESAEGLQKGLDILKDYCDKWKLIVNTNKTKIMIFRKGGTLRKKLNFDYNGENIDIVKKNHIFRGCFYDRIFLFRNAWGSVWKSSESYL